MARQTRQEAPRSISVAEYARRRGVAKSAVQKAIESSRLVKSVDRSAKGKVLGVFPEHADVEWEANTDPALAPSGAGAGPSQFQTARGEKEATLAAAAALKLAKMRGELVDAAAVKRGITDMITKCRTKLLGIPSRARQALPHLSTQDVETIESLVREALEDLTRGAG